ncbi:hypothetical protein RCL1_008647 [Eukaryota sp. TZLM3-RCL]
MPLDFTSSSDNIQTHLAGLWPAAEPVPERLSTSATFSSSHGTSHRNRTASSETRPETVKKDFNFYWTQQRSAEPPARRQLHERPDLDEYAHSVEADAILREKTHEQLKLQQQVFDRQCIRASFAKQQEKRLMMESYLGLDFQREQLALKQASKQRYCTNYEESNIDNVYEELDQFENKIEEIVEKPTCNYGLI